MEIITKDNLKSIKVRVRDQAESRAVQEVLISFGFGWDKGKRKAVSYTDKEVIYADPEDMSLGYSDYEHARLDKTSIWVDFMSVPLLVVRDTLTYNGKVYNKQEFEKAIGGLVPIE